MFFSKQLCKSIFMKIYPHWGILKNGPSLLASDLSMKCPMWILTSWWPEYLPAFQHVHIKQTLVLHTLLNCLANLSCQLKKMQCYYWRKIMKDHKINDELINDDHCFLSITVRHYCLHMHCWDKPFVCMKLYCQIFNIKITVICANNDWKIT